MVQRTFGLKGLFTLFHIIYCFLVMYTTLFVFSIPIFFFFCYRYILSIIFKRFYKGKFKLVECSNAVYGYDRPYNLCTLPFFVYINGPCDIEVLKQRVLQRFTTFRGTNGSKPYKVMLYSVKEKFGFYTWENMRDTFDINDHVRIFSQCGDPDRVYTEAELFQASAELVDNMWDENKPRWEMLVIPKVKKADTGEICSCIQLRLHHIYVDGVSAGQIIRLVVADPPAPEFIFDPVNPKGFHRPWWMKLISYIQIIFLGPWSSLKFSGNKEDHIFYEGPLVGGKMFGRTTMKFPIEKIRKIRRKYKCSTSAIQHVALSTAMRKMAEKKGFPVPDHVLGGLVYALIPYENEYPQNHVTFAFKNFPMGYNKDAGIAERLGYTEKIVSSSKNPFNYYILLTSRVMLGIMGVFPAAVIKKTFGSLRCSYCVSNVPGISGNVYFNGHTVVNVFGMGCLANGIRYFAGVTCYEDNFIFGLQTERCSVLQDEQDLAEYIREFENEMKIIMDSVSHIS